MVKIWETLKLTIFKSGEAATNPAPFVASQINNNTSLSNDTETIDDVFSNKSLLVKISPPQPRRLLNRPRILSYLQEAQNQAVVTIIAANTGFGKTTALVDFTHSSSVPIAWYALDEEDRDLAVFYRYLLDAVRQVYPDFGQSFEELLSYNIRQLYQNPALSARMADEFISNLEALFVKIRTSEPFNPSSLATQVGASAFQAILKPLSYLDFQTEPEPEEKVDVKLILVLDDYQFAESPSINRFVERLIWRMPHGLHLIIASRLMPIDLPITQMQAKQMLYTIDAKDLAFSAAEINALLRQFYAVDEPQIGEALATYSEGWVTAVMLALNNKELLRSKNSWWRRDSSGATDYSTTNNHVNFEQLFDYLAQEVFESQTGELQEFLLRTSVLPLLIPVTCDRLMSVSLENEAGVGASSREAKAFDSEALLKQIEQRNLFVSRRASSPDPNLSESAIQEDATNRATLSLPVVWQYHALFRQFLQDKLNKSQPKLYKKLKVEAAQWEQENGNYLEAVQQLLGADESTQAAVLLNKIADKMYQSGRVNFVSSLLDLITREGETKITDLPELLNVEARIYTERGDNEKALQSYAKASKAYQQKEFLDHQAYSSSLQAQVLLRIGEREEAIALCNGVLHERLTLMRSSLGQQAVALANHVLGILAAEQGKSDEVESFLNQASDIYQANGDSYNLAVVQATFGQLYHNEGRLIRSNIYYQRALEYFVKTGNRSREAYSRTSMAINQYYLGQYQQAEEQLAEVLSLYDARDLSDQYLRLYLLTYLANLCRDKGSYIRAERIYDEAINLARLNHIRKVELGILVDASLNLILQNRKEEAKQLLQLSIELTEAYNLADRIGFSFCAQAWLFFSNSSYKRSFSFMEKAVNAFEGNKPELARSKLGLGVISFALGDTRSALGFLIQSIELCESLGYDPFLSFELIWANTLFEYVAKNRRKLPTASAEAVIDFLTRRGFLQLNSNSNHAQEVFLVKNELPSDADGNLTTATNNQYKKQRREEEGTKFSQNSFPASTKHKHLRVIEVHNPEQDDMTTSESSTDDLTPSVSIVVQPIRSATATLRIYALDGTRVFVNNIEIVDWRRNKERELLLYLLENKQATKDQVLEALWPDVGFSEANIIHVNLASLRKRILPAEIKIVAGKYQVECAIWYDAAEFSQEVSKALALKVEDFNELDAENLGRVLGLFKRDFLDQFYSDWVLERQQQLLGLYTRGTLRLARFYQDTGHIQNALVLWKQFLVKEPYDEESYRAIINCLLKLGNKAEAKQQSLRCLKVLKEIDVRPAVETLELIRQFA